jgi:hypothetical protein
MNCLSLFLRNISTITRSWYSRCSKLGESVLAFDLFLRHYSTVLRVVISRGRERQSFLFALRIMVVFLSHIKTYVVQCTTVHKCITVGRDRRIN